MMGKQYVSDVSLSVMVSTDQSECASSLLWPLPRRETLLNNPQEKLSVIGFLVGLSAKDFWQPCSPSAKN
jgi:hypothetical protein